MQTVLGGIGANSASVTSATGDQTLLIVAAVAIIVIIAAVVGIIAFLKRK